MGGACGPAAPDCRVNQVVMVASFTEPPVDVRHWKYPVTIAVAEVHAPSVKVPVALRSVNFPVAGVDKPIGVELMLELAIRADVDWTAETVPPVMLTLVDC